MIVIGLIAAFVLTTAFAMVLAFGWATLARAGRSIARKFEAPGGNHATGRPKTTHADRSRYTVIGMFVVLAACILSALLNWP